jgi:predicted methyltransferase
MTFKINSVGIAFFLGASILVTAASAKELSPVDAAVANPGRPAADTALDANRKPAEVLKFIGIKPGDKVVDLFAGAYWDLLFSKVVGPTGKVIAFQSVEMAKAIKQTLPPKGSSPYSDYPNIVAQSMPINDLPKTVAQTTTINGIAPPTETTDIVWMRQNYHDMYDPFMGPADVAAVDKGIFLSLKHGGRFVVIDHKAPNGSGLASTNTLHRIDEAVVKKDLTAVGFELEKESDLYSNPADPRDKHSSDPSIKGNTDQFILVFRRP